MISNLFKVIGEIFVAILRTIITIMIMPFIVILWAILAIIYSLALLCVLISAIFCDIWGIETE